MLDHIIWLYGVLFEGEEDLVRMHCVVEVPLTKTWQDSIVFIAEHCAGQWGIWVG